MAEEESDQEAERLGEELVAIVESPPGPAWLRVAGDGTSGTGGSSCGGGGVGISSRDYCRRFCQVRRLSAAWTCHPCLGLPASPGLLVLESGLCPVLYQHNKESEGEASPLHLSGLGWGAGSGTGMTRGLRVAEKVRVCRGGGSGEEDQLPGKLCSTDMPPLPRADPFLPEGPAFLFPTLFLLTS